MWGFDAGMLKLWRSKKHALACHPETGYVAAEEGMGESGVSACGNAFLCMAHPHLSPSLCSPCLQLPGGQRPSPPN